MTAATAFPRAAGAVPVTVGPSSRLNAEAEPTYIPPASLRTVSDIYRRMTAPIRVNGQGPFSFVVDTGANQSVISSELATMLGLPIGPQEPLNGVAGVMNEPTTRASLEIGGRSQTDRVVSVLPAADIGGDGMIGLDGLEGTRLTLDFARQALIIDDGRHHPWDPEEIVLKAHRRDGQLTLVDVDLAGLNLIAFLDSGAQSTIGNMALRSLARTRNPTSRWMQTPIISATGQKIPAEIADLSDLRVGKLRLPTWPVVFADLHTFQMWNMISKPAILLGVSDILSRFEFVRLDFVHDEVRFRLSDPSG